MILAAWFILPNISPLSESDRLAMDAQKLLSMKSEELTSVMGPYLAMGAFLLVLWVAMAATRMPQASDPGTSIDFGPTLGRLLRNRHYLFGVIAQFFYVAAQICVWTFTIHYISWLVESGIAEQTLRSVLSRLGIPDTAAMTGDDIAGKYHFGAMILFLVARFACTALMWVCRPSVMLAFLAVLAIGFCAVVITLPGFVAVLCLIGISGCMSMMFPTIYGIALQGLGDDTKLGGAGLVMAILGGALFPMLQAWLIDTRGVAVSYLVPLACFAVVAAYGMFDIVFSRQHHWNDGSVQ